MPDFVSFDDLFRIARDEVLIRNSSLTLAILQRAGSDANALVAAGVSVGDEVIGQLIRVAASLFMDSSSSTDLDRLLFDRYQLVRIPATPAVVTVDFSTPQPVGAGFSIPVGTQLQTSDGRAFVTTQQANFPTGSSGPIPVPAQSVLAGASQQVAAGLITSITSNIPNAPGTLAVTNPLASAGAGDEESDDHFRNRGKVFWTTSEKGTLAAIQAGAEAVPGVDQATAFELIDPSGAAARLVEVVVADQFTEQLVEAAQTPPSYAVQSAALAANVLAGLSDIRAAGIQVIVTVGVVQLLGISLQLRFRAGVDPIVTTLQAKSAMVAYTNSLKPGQTWDSVAAENALKVIPGLLVLGGEILSPNGPVVPTQLQVLRTSLGLVTA